MPCIFNILGGGGRRRSAETNARFVIRPSRHAHHAPDRDWFAMNALNAPWTAQFIGVKETWFMVAKSWALPRRDRPHRPYHDPRLAACSGGPAEKQLVDMLVSYFSDSIGSFSTVRSGISHACLFDRISHTLVCSASRWDKSLVFKTDATRVSRPNGTKDNKANPRCALLISTVARRRP